MLGEITRDIALFSVLPFALPHSLKCLNHTRGAALKVRLFQTKLIQQKTIRPSYPTMTPLLE